MNAPSQPPPFGPKHTPFDRIGHDATIALAARFYDLMDEREPELVAVHERGPEGRVSQKTRDNFAQFLVEWLGGPRAYSPVHGHPRLRMRHAHVGIGVDLRDAWLRCMNTALEHPSIDAETRAFLEKRFAEVADFLRNVPG